MDMRDNRGVTLVELIVSMAIMMLVSLGVVSLISTGLRAYKSDAAETDLQYEAQLAVNQIKDLVIDTDGTVGYEVQPASGSARFVLSDQEISPGGPASPAIKKLYLYHKADAGDILMITVLTWRESEQKLYYSSYAESEAAGATHEEYLMAEYVSAFSVDLTKLSDQQKLSFSMTFSLDEKRYDGSHTVVLRNQVQKILDEGDRP